MGWLRHGAVLRTGLFVAGLKPRASTGPRVARLGCLVAGWVSVSHPSRKKRERWGTRASNYGASTLNARGIIKIPNPHYIPGEPYSAVNNRLFVPAVVVLSDLVCHDDFGVSKARSLI